MREYSLYSPDLSFRIISNTHASRMHYGQSTGGQNHGPTRGPNTTLDEIAKLIVCGVERHGTARATLTIFCLRNALRGTTCPTRQRGDGRRARSARARRRRPRLECTSRGNRARPKGQAWRPFDKASDRHRTLEGAPGRCQASAATTRESHDETKREYATRAARRHGRPSARRSRAVSRALRHEGYRAASRKALARQARSAARRRSARSRSVAARRAARTKGPQVRRAAARKAARTRQRRGRRSAA